MGLCSSNLTEEQKDIKKRGKEIDKVMREQAYTDQKKVKLLLLGAGESGKSTIFKQMKLIYGQKYTRDELKSFSTTVYANIMQTMTILLNQCTDEQLSELEASSTQEIALVRSYNVGIELNQILGEAVQKLWASDIIKSLWARKSEFHIVGEGMTYVTLNLSRPKSTSSIP